MAPASKSPCPGRPVAHDAGADDRAGAGELPRQSHCGEPIPASVPDACRRPNLRQREPLSRLAPRRGPRYQRATPLWTCCSGSSPRTVTTTRVTAAGVRAPPLTGHGRLTQIPIARSSRQLDRHDAPVPPLCVDVGSMPVRTWLAQIWMFGAAQGMGRPCSQRSLARRSWFLAGQALRARPQ